MQQIYLDYNSTTPIDPRVSETILEYHHRGFVNPSSQHQSGQASRRELERLKTEMIEMLGGNTQGMHADRLIITSGGTESNNLALLGMALDEQGRSLGSILVSAIEHPSITGAAGFLQRRGTSVGMISVDSQGRIRPESLQEQCNDSTRVISVMMANNETGVIQPLTEVTRIARQTNALIHTDAVQAIGKLDVDFRQLDVDALSFTAHKIHGPRGIGGLLIRSSVQLTPLIFGGFQQSGFRPGTEDVAMVAGMHRAMGLYLDHAQENRRRMQQMRDDLQSLILENCPGAVVIGGEVLRVPHTLNVSFPGIDRQAFLMAADIRGLAISTGSACASGSTDPSPVLLAMGLDPSTVEGSIRLSLGPGTTPSEIAESSERISAIFRDLSS